MASDTASTRQCVNDRLDLRSVYLREASIISPFFTCNLPLYREIRSTRRSCAIFNIDAATRTDSGRCDRRSADSLRWGLVPGIQLFVIQLLIIEHVVIQFLGIQFLIIQLVVIQLVVIQFLGIQFLGFRRGVDGIG